MNNVEPLKCSNCGGVLKPDANFCTFCGKKVNDKDIVTPTNIEKIRLLPSYFDSMYSLSEEAMIEVFLKKELEKASIDIKSNLIPGDILKRKKVFNIIFSLLLFIYLSMIFFHFPILTYVIGFIILLIFFKVTRRYNLIKYLKKEIKSRPSEKISNIVMNVKQSFLEDNSKFILLSGVLLAIALPMIIFVNPRIIYEKVEGGYAMRYYAFGLSNFKTVSIPSEYKGEPVVSLRGNAFSNMFFLKSATLPNSLKEIRGQAFENDILLDTVNIPNRLEYLGGGSFRNCLSLKSISLPDTLTYLGGEAFYGATSLENIKLSNNLTEIRGDTFEYCYSLKSITIPDSVTRIGGHAFYGCSSLSEVNLTENSRLAEIGSSAFRLCDSLESITIPKNTFVNGRAFKESPTYVKRFGQSDSEDYNYNYYDFDY